MGIRNSCSLCVYGRTFPTGPRGSNGAFPGQGGQDRTSKWGGGGDGGVEGGQWLIIWGEKTKRDDRGVSNPKGSCTPLKASRFLSFLVFFFCCHFFTVVKHTYHEVCYFNHFPVCNSVALSTSTMLCNHSYTTVHSLSQAAYTPNVSWPQMESLPSLSSTSRPPHPPSPGLPCSSRSRTRFPTVPSTLSPHPQHTHLSMRQW